MDNRIHSTHCGVFMTLALQIALLLAVACGQRQAPYGVGEGLFGRDSLSTAGFEVYPGAETFTVFRAEEEMDLYANGAVLAKFQGRFYCMWQASERDEDSPDTHLVYAVSDDAEHWSAPMDLSGQGCTSGGWWNAGDSLVAYVNVWPEGLVPRAVRRGTVPVPTAWNGRRCGRSGWRTGVRWQASWNRIRTGSETGS